MASTKTLVGFIAGVTIGVLALAIFAPDKASKTWHKLKRTAKDEDDPVDEAIDDFIDDSSKALSEAKSEVKS